jgi:hypothetical protein
MSARKKCGLGGCHGRCSECPRCPQCRGGRMDVKSMDATDVVFGVALTFLVLSVLSAPWVRRHIGGVAQVCRRSVCALVLGLCRASPLPSCAHLSSVTFSFSCVTAVAAGASPLPYPPLPSPTCGPHELTPRGVGNLGCGRLEAHQGRARRRGRVCLVPCRARADRWRWRSRRHLHLPHAAHVTTTFQQATGVLDTSKAPP